MQLNLGRNLDGSGDVAQACSLLADNCDIISSLASTRLHQRIDMIAHTIRIPAVVTEVREFLARCAARG
ncbi:hypothetical protein AB0B25_03240 [Nocardia sp. NPDC049190]|uniref:hypothetical protein n=1 Tax=Nocardia sp. NPDC049190 TaxID=3155650 RepID=UPI0033F70FC7